jgi:hypothetical protein
MLDNDLKNPRRFFTCACTVLVKYRALCCHEFTLVARTFGVRRGKHREVGLERPISLSTSVNVCFSNIEPLTSTVREQTYMQLI